MAAGRMGWKLTLILSAGSGLLAGVALPPLGWPPLLWLSLAVLWGLSPRPWAGLLWGFAAIGVSHRWLLGLHPLDWIGVPSPLSLPLCVLLLLVIAGVGGLLVGLWLWMVQRLDPAHLATAVLLSLLWGLVEMLLAGGPLFWLGLGASALPADRPLAALAALGGSGLVAAVQLMIGWLLWRACCGPRRQRALLTWLMLVLLCHGLGASVLAAAPLAGPSESVLVLQPAIPTREKFEPVQRLALRRQLAAALAQARLQGAALLVLPEGALGLEPRLPEPAPVELISGGFRWHEGPDLFEQRSTLLRFAPDEQQPSSWVDKHRLVPLGEWVPFAGLVRWSGLSAVGGVEPGPASRLLTRPAGSIAAAICYELSDGGALARAVRNGARWLLASANLDPYPLLLQQQFVALSQLRAIETGRWLVSAANTGPSLLMSPRGEPVAQLPPAQAGVLAVRVPQLRLLTPYDRAGDLPMLVLAVAAALWRWRRRGLSADTSAAARPPERLGHHR
ncbi:MAG: apolipoprotein N-acyltransferase [Cyanobacteria bacterium K_DeepCast_35m_m2_023]|nr:apolipoprotein N-acyltransferase [Cyanobacteria bacterium K_DeepCast_35m_m2_023]